MPLYEYECAKCGERTEAIQRTSDPLLTVCPNCGGKLRKLLSAPAFQFKGSGFYLTDYGKSGAKAEEKSGEKDKDKDKDKEKISSKGEEGKGTGSGAPSGGEAGESKESKETKETGREDSSKGKEGGAPGAAPAPPAGSPVPAPSKKKKSADKK